MYIHFLALLVLLFSSAYASNTCQPFHTTFPPGSVAGDSNTPSSAPFVAISPQGSYNLGNDGLELYLKKPPGEVTTRKGVNDNTADGATVNSTFTLLYGKVTYEVAAPLVAGVVTAVILIADERDEIDIELLGGDPSHWQTNVFAPSPHDSRPLYGVFSSIENEPHGTSISDLHSYSIDWDPKRIIWSIDGKAVRTLTIEQTLKDGSHHYPSHSARIQLGIWDASSPSGTAAWAKGPIDWKTAPKKMMAVVKGVAVEC